MEMLLNSVDALLFKDWREDLVSSAWVLDVLIATDTPLRFYGWRRTSSIRWLALRPCRLAHTSCNLLGRLAQADYRVKASNACWLSSQKRFCWPHPTTHRVPGTPCGPNERSWTVNRSTDVSASRQTRRLGSHALLELVLSQAAVPRTYSRAIQDTC